MSAQLLQFGGSLIAIFALAGLALLLGLGGKPKLRERDAVQKAASEVEDGFAVTDFIICANGQAALAKDAGDRIVAIKLHGNRFAGRVLTSEAHADCNPGGLIVKTSEARFGSVALVTDNSAYWAKAINRLDKSDDD